MALASRLCPRRGRAPTPHRERRRRDGPSAFCQIGHTSFSSVADRIIYGNRFCDRGSPVASVSNVTAGGGGRSCRHGGHVEA